MDLWDIGDYFLLETLQKFAFTKFEQKLVESSAYIQYRHQTRSSLDPPGFTDYVRYLYERDTPAKASFLRACLACIHSSRFTLLECPTFVTLLKENPLISHDILMGMMDSGDFSYFQYPYKCSNCKQRDYRVPGKHFTRITAALVYREVLCAECENKAGANERIERWDPRHFHELR